MRVFVGPRIIVRHKVKEKLIPNGKKGMRRNYSRIVLWGERGGGGADLGYIVCQLTYGRRSNDVIRNEHWISSTNYFNDHTLFAVLIYLLVIEFMCHSMIKMNEPDHAMLKFQFIGKLITYVLRIYLYLHKHQIAMECIS